MIRSRKDQIRLEELGRMSDAERRRAFIRDMPAAELDGYEAEHKRRGLLPYEVEAIAKRRKFLGVRK